MSDTFDLLKNDNVVELGMLWNFYYIYRNSVCRVQSYLSQFCPLSL